MISITSDWYQPIFLLQHFLDHLRLFHSLNAAHFENSTAYNFLICEQKHQVWVVIFLVRTWKTFWYQNNSDLLKFFEFEFFNTSCFSKWGNACNLCYATSSKNDDVVYDVTCPALWRWINFFLFVSPDDYRSCRLIQVFCHNYSFVFFCIIAIGLEAWLTNWLTVHLLKKYKIKRKFTFFSKYQIYFISWVENIEIFIRAAHFWKFVCFQHTWWNIFGIHLKKVNILYVHLWVNRIYQLGIHKNATEVQILALKYILSGI